MAGNKAGALKTKQKNLEKDPNYYANLGKKSWKSDRSHEVGFAKLPKEKHLELSSKGGKKKKQDYKRTEAEEAGTSTSE